MDLVKLATELFMKRLGGTGSNLNEGLVGAALGKLLGGADGQIDLGDILGRLNGGGLGALAQSWLGDGDNASIGADDIARLFPSSELGAFASDLGIGESEARHGLAGMLPELIDRNSKGGSLLDAVGGAGGLLGAASKFLR